MQDTPAKESAIPWLVAAIILHVLYLGFAFYLVRYEHFTLWPALGTATGCALLFGLALRLAMPPSAGGWAIGAPTLRIMRRAIIAFLRPWLRPAPTAADSDKGETGSEAV